VTQLGFITIIRVLGDYIKLLKTVRTDRQRERMRGRLWPTTSWTSSSQLLPILCSTTCFDVKWTYNWNECLLSHWIISETNGRSSCRPPFNTMLFWKQVLNYFTNEKIPQKLCLKWLLKISCLCENKLQSNIHIFIDQTIVNSFL